MERYLYGKKILQLWGIKKVELFELVKLKFLAQLSPEPVLTYR